MEVIQIENQSKNTGRFNEETIVKAIKQVLEANKKSGKVSGYRLKEFLKECYSGDRPNLGALRKKIEEIGYKHQLGEVKATISVKSNTIGFYIKSK